MPTVRDDREQLILEHLPQVRGIARRIHERLPPNVHLDDLISAGILGLISAIDNFDASQSAKLSTYAEYKIRGAILDSLRGMDWAPRLRRKRARTIDAAIAAAEQRLGRTATEEEIAAELRISLEQYREWLVEIQGLGMSAFAEDPSDSSGLAALSRMVDPRSALPSSLVEKAEMETLLAEAIGGLPPAERNVLSLYYQEEMAPHEIAQIMRVRGSRVSQLKAQGLARLRSRLEQRLTLKQEEE